MLTGFQASDMCVMRPILICRTLASKDDAGYLDNFSHGDPPVYFFQFLTQTRRPGIVNISSTREFRANELIKVEENSGLLGGKVSW